MEDWIAVKGYEGLYEISNKGRVKSLPREMHNGTGTYISKEKLLKPWLRHDGYLDVLLYKDGKRKHFRLHQLVAIGFMGHEPTGVYDNVVTHIDLNRFNNNVENLKIKKRIVKSKAIHN